MKSERLKIQKCLVQTKVNFKYRFLEAWAKFFDIMVAMNPILSILKHSFFLKVNSQSVSANVNLSKLYEMTLYSPSEYQTVTTSVLTVLSQDTFKPELSYSCAHRRNMSKLPPIVPLFPHDKSFCVCIVSLSCSCTHILSPWRYRNSLLFYDIVSACQCVYVFPMFPQVISNLLVF